MTAPDTTAYQANFKTPNGTLINVYADNGAEFGELLEGLEDHVAKIAALESTLAAAGTAARLPLAAPSQQPAQPAPQQAPPAQAWGNPPAEQQQQGHLCDHGEPMRLVAAGVSKATGKPYPAFYACARSRAESCGKTIRT